MTTSCIARQLTAAATVALCGVLSTACQINKTTAPGVAGPSEFGVSVALSASPDHLLQDGVSKTTVTATVRDDQGAAMSGVTLAWSVSSSDSNTTASPSSPQSTTDATGKASVQLTAPAPPATLSTSPVLLTVTATPVGGDRAAGTPRPVVVELVPPAGTLPSNNPPQPAFSIVPSVANINQDVRFDASETMDEGRPCGSNCSYLWDFGDITTDSGMTVGHRFTLPGNYVITLTVTDARGSVRSTSKTLTVSGPAEPKAVFTVTPTSPAPNVQVTFNATGSTVGTGATIVEYSWNFGDGSAQVTTAIPAVQKSYTAAGTYLVVLTVTDSLGRQATTPGTVTVQ